MLKNRKKIPYKSGKRDFTRTASAVNKRNAPRRQARGGIRL